MSGVAMAEEEIDYESDPEEANLSLKMRRRVASDDEAEEGGEIRDSRFRRVGDSDEESEGAAAEAEYDDECEEDEGEEEEYDLQEYAVEVGGGGKGEDGVTAVVVKPAEEGTDGGATRELEEKTENDDSSEFKHDNEDGQHEGEKKEKEPYAVPTAGAFYMHDDRFGDNAGGRNSEIDYESDPEEANLSLKMRRRVASDDEAEEGGEIRDLPLRRVGDSDEESEGAAAEYDDECEEEEGEEEEYDLQEYAGEMEKVDGGGKGVDGVTAVVVEPADVGTDGGATRGLEEKTENDDSSEFKHDTEDGQHEGEKKEIEPFAVPTAGAFYMHDDRFRENSGGRNRRTLGGRRLWESKDNRKWGHDKFEELTMQGRSYEEHGRGFRGRNRGRGINRNVDRGYDRVNKTETQANYRNQNNNNQNYTPKAVRGRGPRRYQPSLKNNEQPLTQNKQSGKLVQKPSYVVKASDSMSNLEPGMVRPRKQAFASNLNISSPPFYPSGSSTKDNNLPNKRDVKDGSMNRNGQNSVPGGNYTMEQPSGELREKNMADSVGVDKLYISNPHSAMAYKPANTKQMPLSGPSSVNSTQQLFRGQGRGMASFTQMAYRPVVPNNQVNRGNPQNQLQTQSNPGQTRAQSYEQASDQQFTQRVPSGSQAASTSKAIGAVNAVESELEALSGTNKSKTALVPTGKGSGQGSGRGSFLYGGAQVLGSSDNTSSGDQNFPAFLPVMPFGGQHPGGMGVPAVGMAFPGYVGQPQLGLGNSEMTWLPILAGAAGALGARYRSPYISVDSSYHARPSGEMSSTTDVSSKENHASNVGNDWKPAQKPDIANDDPGQRQKNPRRYTEMKFDQ